MHKPIVKVMVPILYLASNSIGRQEMLRESGIPFRVLSHRSKEEAEIKFCSDRQSQEAYVESIARDKLKNIDIPKPSVDSGDAKTVAVLVGDTLVFDSSGQMLSKPVDKDDAVRMLRALNEGPGIVISCSVLGLFEWTDGRWNCSKEKVLSETCKFLWQIPENEFDFYFENEPGYLRYSSGATIDRAGSQYTKWISGSPSAVMGMPLFSVRQTLSEWGLLKR